MITLRVLVEEMHVYYFIAKKLISNAKLGLIGFIASQEERLLNSIYNSWDLDEIDKLSNKLFDKIDSKQIKLKLNANVQGLKDIESLISEAVFYVPNLLFKSEVLDNVKTTLEADLSTYDRTILCVEKIVQAKIALMEESLEIRKNILDGTEIEVGKVKRIEGQASVMAVDAENILNVLEANVESATFDVNSTEMSFDDNIEAVIGKEKESRNGFTVEDIQLESIKYSAASENDLMEISSISDKLEKIGEDAEVLDFDDEQKADGE